MKDTPTMKRKRKKIEPDVDVYKHEPKLNIGLFCLSCLTASEIENIWRENRRKIDERNEIFSADI